ncbi:Reverse transcriptase domain-containing protein, partial [Aphis craccivora]
MDSNGLVILEQQKPNKLKEIDDPNLPITSHKSETVQLPITYESDNLQLPISDQTSVPFITRNFNFYGIIKTSKKKNITNKRVWDKVDHCLLCENNVTNFTRHLLRKHSNEIEVIRFMALPKGSAERKMEADILRNRGNFLLNVDGKTKIKPVRRPYEFETKTSHFKICKNVKIKSNARNQPQANGQNIILTFTETDEQLLKNVFPRMAPDQISLVAKSDNLIKAFRTRYLKCHEEKHLVAVVSQKMRTLASYLIAMKKENNQISSLEDCLTPNYASPSVILKLGQSLKQCCEIAEFIFFKEQHGNINQQENVKAVQNMKYLIETQWSHKISSNALKEITQNKWDKPAILPFTSDIKLFRNHLLKIENESYNKLKVNPENLHAYRNLQDSILALLNLHNHRRSGEIQRIHLDTYTNFISEISPKEIVQALSPMETELIKNFKQYLLQLRKIVSFINKDNPYLFPLTQSPNNCVRASDLIRKFGDECGAQHPENITSTRLRKHVATVTQLLNLSEGDIEQLSTFMENSVNVHKEYYRLSDNAFQVAKVGKLLFMMGKGQGNKYRGKSLDEIDIDVDELVSGEEEDSADEENEIIINQTTALKTIEFNKNKSNSSAKVKSQKQVKLGTK